MFLICLSHLYILYVHYFQAGRNYGDVDFGLRIGGYKSIDRKQEFLPLVEPSVVSTISQTVGDDICYQKNNTV